MFFIEKIFAFLILLIPLLIAVAFFTLAERKVMAAIQQRKGPNVVGFIGLLQPIADAVKLIVKEAIIPTNANTFTFVLAPVLTLFLSLVSWAVMPFSTKAFFSCIDLSVLFVLASSSLCVYGVFLSGWASNSRYAFFGAIRSAGQMISYEISLGLNLMIVLLYVGSLDLIMVSACQSFIFFLVPFLPVFFVFMVSILAETNRAPFDLPEAESELVSGFNVEYSSMGFALFFLAEYGAMIMMSAISVIFFLGGWNLIITPNILNSAIFFSIKTSFIFFFYIWVRASFPRYRIDQLMRLCWKIFLPIVLCYIFVVLCAVYAFNGYL